MYCRQLILTLFAFAFTEKKNDNQFSHSFAFARLISTAHQIQKEAKSSGVDFSLNYDWFEYNKREDTLKNLVKLSIINCGEKKSRRREKNESEKKVVRLHFDRAFRYENDGRKSISHSNKCISVFEITISIFTYLVSFYQILSLNNCQFFEYFNGNFLSNYFLFQFSN